MTEPDRLNRSTFAPSSSQPTLTDQTSLFSLLADENRLRILRALYESSGPDGETGLSFSTLRREAEFRDSGKFNYHLNRLRGPLIEKTDSCYRLTPHGINLIGALSEDTVEETE